MQERRRNGEATTHRIAMLKTQIKVLDIKL